MPELLIVVDVEGLLGCAIAGPLGRIHDVTSATVLLANIYLAHIDQAKRDCCLHLRRVVANLGDCCFARTPAKGGA